MPNIFVSNIAVYLIIKKVKKLKAPCQAGTTASPNECSIRVVKRALKQKLLDVYIFLGCLSNFNLRICLDVGNLKEISTTLSDSMKIPLNFLLT